MTDLPKIDLSVLNQTTDDKRAEQNDAGSNQGTLQGKVPVEEGWAKQRKATPLNRLLDSTTRWAEGLPLEVKPHALMAKYPRLANMAAASWNSASAFRDYLDILLVDRRGGRKGFPPEILAEFEQLRTFYFFGWYKSKTGISLYREGPPDASIHE